MIVFVNRTRRKQETRKYTTATWVMGGILAIMRPISTYSVNINSCATIARGRVYGLLKPISTSTVITTFITTVINFMIARGRVAVILRPILTFIIVTTLITT